MKELYRLKKGKGTYGNGQTQISKEDLLLINRESEVSSNTITLSNTSELIIPEYQSGTNITIDKTDPLKPIINSSLVGFYEEYLFTPTMFAASLEEYTSTSAYGKAIRVGNLITYKIVFKGLINPSNVSSTSSNSGLFISGCPINATFDGGLYGNHGDITTLEDFESVEEGVDISDMYLLMTTSLLLVDKKSNRINDVLFKNNGDFVASGTYMTDVYTP